MSLELDRAEPDFNLQLSAQSNQNLRAFSTAGLTCHVRIFGGKMAGMAGTIILTVFYASWKRWLNLIPLASGLPCSVTPK